MRCRNGGRCPWSPQSDRLRLRLGLLRRGAVALFLLWSFVRGGASPSSSPSEPCVLSGGFVLVFAAVVLRTCRLDQALMSWSGSTTGGVGPCPVSESDSLLVDLLLELDSPSGAAAAGGCSLRSGLGGGGLTPGGAPACDAGWLLARSFRAASICYACNVGPLLRPLSCYFLVGSFQFSILPDSGGLALLFAPPVLARRALRAYCLAPLFFLGRGCRAVPVLLEGGFILSPAPPFLVVGSPHPSPSPFLGVVTPLPFPIPGHCAKNLAMGEVPSSLLLPFLLPVGREGGGLRRAGLWLPPACATSSSLPGLLPGKRVSGWV